MATAPDRTSTVVRMIGQVRGREVELTRETASSAVLSSGNRIPLYLESYSRHGIEIDLRHVLGEATIALREVPGEDGLNGKYYRQAKAAIDRVINHKLNERIAGDHVSHLSIFGFARLPLLVYLGSRLDDTVPTDVYQCHRHSESWSWSDEGETVTFGTHRDLEPHPDAGDQAVLVLNISGTIQAEELPTNLALLPRFRVSPEAIAAVPDVMWHREGLSNFQRGWLHPQMPIIVDPSCRQTSFNHRWEQDKYANFAKCIHSYATRKRTALDEEDKDKSIRLWRNLFGEGFKAPTTVTLAAPTKTTQSTALARRAPAEKFIKEMGFPLVGKHQAHITAASRSASDAARATYAEHGSLRSDERSHSQ